MKFARILCRSVLALATLCLTACTVTRADAEPSPDAELARSVDALVAPLVAAHELSGAIVMMRRGRTVYQRGFGMANHAAGVPFTPDTPADGGSLAKTFTAAGIWSLVEEGRIELDVPATRYVSEFPHPATTVRQLITHSNGLTPQYEFFDAHFAADEVRTTTALLRVVARHAPRPSFPPGSRFEYSGLGFDVAALAIERVTGQRYEAFVKGRFFDPLGMTSSLARPARLADWPGVRTMGYRWREGAWSVYDVFDMEAFLGASNLYFSAADLARWGSANAMGTALPAAVFEAGQKPVAIGSGYSGLTGLGWYCDSSGNRCRYPGVLNAFQSVVYFDRVRGESVALVSNSSMRPWRFVSLQRALVDVLAERPPAAEASIAFERFDQVRRPTVAGSYRADALGTVTIRAGSDGLQLRVGEGLEYGMFPASAEVLYVPGLDYYVAFTGGDPPPTIHIRSIAIDVVGRRQ